MAMSLPYELLRIVFDECAGDPFTLHSCVLVNRNWCVLALQYLWAKPFTLLLSKLKLGSTRSIENLITTFIECFTDIDSLENALQTCKHNRKKFPFDYSLYLKEIHFHEIHSLGTRTRLNMTNMPIMTVIAHLAIVYCPNLTTLSLTYHASHQLAFYINEKWTLPRLQSLSLSLNLHYGAFCTLSRAAHKLESISVEGLDIHSLAEQIPHGLTELIQSQHQLKAITIKNIAEIDMGSLFKLLESQSNTLESIVLEGSHLCQDAIKIEQMKFPQLTTICIKHSWISERGLKVIVEADLPKLKQLKIEDTGLHESDWIPLENKYPQLVYSGEYFY
ncbi:4222_t:CDS:1 [Paraglomus occultum]|uniref:4222_t:CDS:1 n=1 Tax=Paraglomus occultum TaxID=144539 RepID=A0A9N9F4Q6_9GLOM|nr:4222_t:CDS:1 [Paraglomus occultum]